MTLGIKEERTPKDHCGRCYGADRTLSHCDRRGSDGVVVAARRKSSLACTFPNRFIDRSHPQTAAWGRRMLVADALRLLAANY